MTASHNDPKSQAVGGRRVSATATLETVWRHTLSGTTKPAPYSPWGRAFRCTQPGRASALEREQAILRPDFKQWRAQAAARFALTQPAHGIGTWLLGR